MRPTTTPRRLPRGSMPQMWSVFFLVIACICECALCTSFRVLSPSRSLTLSFWLLFPEISHPSLTALTTLLLSSSSIIVCDAERRVSVNARDFSTRGRPCAYVDPSQVQLGHKRLRMFLAGGVFCDSGGSSSSSSAMHQYWCLAHPWLLLLFPSCTCERN